MRGVSWTTLLAVFLVLFQGCTLRTEYLIVNNTGDRMVMLAPRSLNEDYKDYPVIIDYYSREENSQTIEDQSSAPSGHGPVFDYSQAGVEYRYSSGYRYLPSKYRKGFRPFSDEYVVQVEPDGRIFLLDPKEDIPARDFPDQPEGYPLVPEKTAVSR